MVLVEVNVGSSSRKSLDLESVDGDRQCEGAPPLLAVEMSEPNSTTQGEVP